MTERWYRTRDLAGLPGMASRQAIQKHGPTRGWISRPAPGHSQALEWLESSLPEETQAALRERRGEASAPSLPPPCRGGVADARLEIVAAFDRWRKSRNLALVPALKEWAPIYNVSGCGVSEETRAHYPSVAWNTVQRWRRKRAERGTQGLLPGRGGRKSLIETSIDFLEEAEALIFERPHHITASEILETVEARYPDRDMPGIDAIRRWMRKWRARNPRALSAVANPDKHRSRRMPAFGDANAEIEGLNYLWELDSTPADAIRSDGKRYAIVVGIDVWSRRTRCVVAPTSSATAIAALLRRTLGARSLGEPRAREHMARGGERRGARTPRRPHLRRAVVARSAAGSRRLAATREPGRAGRRLNSGAGGKRACRPRSGSASGTGNRSDGSRK